MDWSIQLALKDCIAAGGVAATVAGIVAAVRVSRLKSRTHCDQQYFIEYSKRYQELVSQAPGDIRDPNFQLVGRQDYDLVLWLTHAYLDMCFEQWFLGRQGWVSSRLWSLWRKGMEFWIFSSSLAASLEGHPRRQEVRQRLSAVRRAIMLSRLSEGRRIARVAGKRRLRHVRVYHRVTPRWERRSRGEIEF